METLQDLIILFHKIEDKWKSEFAYIEATHEFNVCLIEFGQIFDSTLFAWSWDGQNLNLFSYRRDCRDTEIEVEFKRQNSIMQNRKYLVQIVENLSELYKKLLDFKSLKVDKKIFDKLSDLY